MLWPWLFLLFSALQDLLHSEHRPHCLPLQLSQLSTSADQTSGCASRKWGACTWWIYAKGLVYLTWLLTYRNFVAQRGIKFSRQLWTPVTMTLYFLFLQLFALFSTGSQFSHRMMPGNVKIRLSQSTHVLCTSYLTMHSAVSILIWYLLFLELPHTAVTSHVN